MYISVVSENIEDNLNTLCTGFFIQSYIESRKSQDLNQSFVEAIWESSNIEDEKCPLYF